MKTPKEPKFVAATLKWCNEQRKERGKQPLAKLPKGKQQDGYSCPCGKACGLFVGRNHYWENVLTDPDGRIPMAVTQFVDAFDSGKLPQYQL